MNPLPGAHRLRLLRWSAWLALTWEATVRTGWRALCWCGFFAALWLLQIPALFGAAVSILTVMVFFGGLAATVWRGRRDERLPGAAAIDRRLEQDSAVAHRPLAHLADTLANPARADAGTFWTHRDRQAREALRRLRPARPRPQLAGQDAAALRVAVLLFLMMAWLVAGPQAGRRVLDGLWPFTGSASSAATANDGMVMWITPPAYTHLPRITLEGGASGHEKIIVPAGSVIKARVRGGFWTPVLRMGGTRLKLQRSGDKDAAVWLGEMKAAPGTRLSLRQGLLTRLSLPVAYAVDQPPRIVMKTPPVALPKGGLQFDVAVNDDYGVVSLRVAVKPDPAATLPPIGEAETQERAVMSAAGKEIELKPVFDLTGHPWAGLPVFLEIAAKDGAGHVVTAPPVRFILPERPFQNPAAQEVVALRKQLIAEPKRSASDVAEGLENVLAHVGLYNGDVVTFLALRSAASRLIWNRKDNPAPSVVAQTWQTALRIEDGNLSLTSQALRDAQDALQKLLDNPNATSAQLAAAMDNVRAAMGRYLAQLYQTLLRQMARNGQDPSKLTPDAFKRKLDVDQLSAFLDQMQAKAASGDRDAARSMLAQLQQLSDKLDPAAAGSGMTPQMQAMLKTLDGLNTLLQNQRKLHDRTGQAKKDGKPTSDQRPDQEALRHQLGDAMAQIGAAGSPIPEALQKAEQAMRAASAALQGDQPDPALAGQQTAIDQLQQGGKTMQQKLQRMVSMGLGPTDPLGRPLDNGAPSLLPNSDIKVPDQAQRRQVQEILKTLRDRAGDYSRPDYELDYYRRLMKQF